MQMPGGAYTYRAYKNMQRRPDARKRLPALCTLRKVGSTGGAYDLVY